jgi:hypothetical protein
MVLAIALLKPWRKRVVVEAHLLAPVSPMNRVATA